MEEIEDGSALLDKLEKQFSKGIPGYDCGFEKYYNTIPKDSCEICGEKRYLERCHIIPRSFDYFTIKSEDPKSNILILCPNCHKYFDTGILNAKETAIIEVKVLKAIGNFYEGIKYIYEYSEIKFNLKNTEESNKRSIEHVNNTILKKTRNAWLKNLIKEKQLSSIGEQEVII